MRSIAYGLSSQPSPLSTCCVFSFYFLLQYEYFNAVLINEDKGREFWSWGKEFILAPNDHFNNLPVNISLSDVKVPAWHATTKVKTYCHWSFRVMRRQGVNLRGGWTIVCFWKMWLEAQYFSQAWWQYRWSVPLLVGDSRLAFSGFCVVLGPLNL